MLDSDRIEQWRLKPAEQWYVVLPYHTFKHRSRIDVPKAGRLRAEAVYRPGKYSRWPEAPQPVRDGAHEQLAVLTLPPGVRCFRLS